ncbi:MAG: ABC-2 family transporter protein [Bdellovibrionales bacterium]|nr:ABC-2 family transporter protein [Bdellovibrionales bacterium]
MNAEALAAGKAAFAFDRSFKSDMRIYAGFIRNGFLNMLAYRLRYVTGILTYLLLVSVQFFIWQGVYSDSAAGATIKGYSLSEMITYVAIGWIARSFYHSNIDYDIADLVRTGQISIYLIRPVNFQLMLIFNSMGESLFRIACFSWPIALTILLVFPVQLPAGLLAFFMFCFSTLVGFIVLAQFNFLIGMAAFPLKSIQGIMRAKYFIIQLLSGLLLPLTFFPDWFRSALEVLPFKLISYIPLQFYLGKVDSSQIAGIVLTQVAWIAVLWFAGRYFWMRAFSRLTLQGG